MANRWAVASTAWSLLSTWNGGASLPASGDDVYANNFNVSIDQTITANTLRKTAGSGITAGGSFVVTAAATVNITAGILGAHFGGTGYLVGINAGSAAVTVNGNVTAGDSNGYYGISVLSGYTGTLTVNGNITAGGFSTDASGLSCAATSATVAVIGNVAATGNSPGISNTGASPVISVTGNVTGASATGYGVYNTGASAQFSVNGTVTGGTGTTAYGVYSTGSTAQITVAGTVIGGAGATAYGIHMTAGYLRVDALLRYGTTGTAPIHCQGCVPQFKRAGSALGIQAPSDDNWPNATGSAIVVQRYTTGNPDPSDVREGVVYDSTGMSTGTLAVPPPSSVAAGVPTDDTVGTAAVSLADVLAGTGAQIAAATSG
jgi:hypothetical protein